MSYLTERASYLQGLADGLKINEDTNEGKLLLAMLDLIDEMASELDDLDERQTDVEELLDDLTEDFDDEDDDMEYYEITCEKCGNKIYLDEDLLDSDEDIYCQVCGEKIEIEFDCECDCGCHDHE
ncbi:MAG: hypothetical protein IJY55_01430 [Clostridia bacterium]|nr:hypothetical protein [Clostridia bacterium]